mmetsp:Transcript_113034/g.365002  ORF Transcript_113034/g.365002 Transcript_113034/m.365002 type:complete len:227 (-) Transcript_113034:347-1027(-)
MPADVLLVWRSHVLDGEQCGHQQKCVQAEARQPDVLGVLDDIFITLRHEGLEARDHAHLLVEVAAVRGLVGLLLLRVLVLLRSLPRFDARLRPNGRDLGGHDPVVPRRLVHEHEVGILGRPEAVLDRHVILDLGVCGDSLEDVLNLGDAPIEAGVLSELLRCHVPVYPVGEVERLLNALAPSDEHGVNVRYLAPLLLLRLLYHELGLVKGPDAKLVAGRPLLGFLL